VTSQAEHEAVRARGKKSPLVKKLYEYRALYVMLIPALVILLLMNYLPMFGALIAFKEIDYSLGIIRSPWIGFKNFEFLFASASAWPIVRNTLGYNITFIVTGPVVSVTLAILLNELTNRRTAKVYQTLIIMPHFISMVVVSYLVYAFLAHQSGFVNSNIVPLFGGEGVKWYYEPAYWPFLLFFVHGWKHWGYGTVIYLATMAGFDQQLYEAAAIDGASRLRQVVHITVPLLTPIIIMLFILSLGRIFNSDFGLFYQVPRNSGPLHPVTQTLDVFTYRALMQLGDLGMASAAAFFQSVVGFFTILTANLVVRKMNPERAMF
jgi:putative aldouronate transport system permease protein